MKVSVSHVSQLKIPGLDNGSSEGVTLTVEKGSSVEDLLRSLGVAPIHLRFIKPFINNREAHRNTFLSDGDTLFLFLAAGGG